MAGISLKVHALDGKVHTFVLPETVDLTSLQRDIETADVLVLRKGRYIESFRMENVVKIAIGDPGDDDNVSF